MTLVHTHQGGEGEGGEWGEEEEKKKHTSTWLQILRDVIIGVVTMWFIAYPLMIFPLKIK